jgi:hypothetical protein
MALFALSIVANLPSAYRSQREFNEANHRAQGPAAEAEGNGR